MKQVIFTLASARSGTLYLSHLFRNNVPECVCRHEPFFDWGNPTMLGPAIYEAYAGRLDALRSRMAQKRDYINRRRGTAYLESSHAFLKSAYRVALEFFPNLQLVHLIRNPLSVAKSEAYRETWRRRVHAPFHYYTGQDGRRHFYWGLTLNEPIFGHFDLARLSLFQRYLLQWIEIENRAMAFLDEHRLHDRCFTLAVPRGLHDRRLLQEMFDFLGLKIARHEVVLGGRTNRSWGPRTVVTHEDEDQARQVLAAVPAHYLDIFRCEPYASHEWSAWLHPATARDPSPCRLSH